MSTREIMDRKCSAGNSHRMMGIVEEAIVLLFLYFSTSASLLMSISILPSTFFLRSISPIPYPASLYVTKCSICLDCIVQAEEEKREKTKDSEREREREARWKKRDWGDERNEWLWIRRWFGCYGWFDPRDAALALCFWYINFLWMARVWAGAHCSVSYPRYRHPSPHRRDFPGLLSLALFLSSVPLVSVFFGFALSWWSEAWSSPLRDRPSVYESVTGREDDTWRNFRIYWPRGRLPPVLLHRRLVPTFSRKRHSTMAGGAYVI